MRGEPSFDLQAANLDHLVTVRLKRLGIQPAPLCSDAMFVRRAFLDAIGTLPTADETGAFLEDKGPGKREKLVDDLLQREEFADYWAMKWSDVLRVKSEFPINLWPLAAQAYHHWIRTAIQQDWPFDRIAWTLLTANGSNFRAPDVNFYRAVPSKKPETLAQFFALTFLGVRTEKWPRKKLADLAAFFSAVGFKATGEWKEEIVFHDPGKIAKPTTMTLPDGTGVRIAAGEDPRRALGKWLIAPNNLWFARSAANRLWNWMFGRGIVHEPDDFRADNPPRNPELLAFLEKELVGAKFDLKHVIRLILNSHTYQRDSIAQAKGAEDELACYRIRRVEAEVLIDAIDQITGSTESYSSMAPEPYSFIPETQRSIALADGSITSPFLEMFGRPPRDTGLDSERNNRPSAAQKLHLLNSSHVLRKIDRGPKMVALYRSSEAAANKVDKVYLTVLSRHPTDEEKQVALGYLKASAGQQQGLADLVWAAINSSEFLYRH